MSKKQNDGVIYVDVWGVQTNESVPDRDDLIHPNLHTHLTGDTMTYVAHGERFMNFSLTDSLSF